MTYYNMKKFIKEYEKSLSEIINKGIIEDYNKFYVDGSGTVEDTLIELFYDFNNYMNLRIIMKSFMIFNEIESYNTTPKKLKKILLEDPNSLNFPQKCKDFMDNEVLNNKDYFISFLKDEAPGNYMFMKWGFGAAIVNIVKGMLETEEAIEYFEFILEKLSKDINSLQHPQKIEKELLRFYSKVEAISRSIDCAHYDGEVEHKGVEYWNIVEKVIKIYKKLMIKDYTFLDSSYFIKENMKNAENYYVEFLVRLYLISNYNWSIKKAQAYSFNYAREYNMHVLGSNTYINILESVDKDLSEDNGYPLSWHLIL